MCVLNSYVPSQITEKIASYLFIFKQHKITDIATLQA